VNFRAAAAGFDVVVHSATKALNGHSDLVAGAIVGSASWISKIRARLMHLGGSLDAHACWLFHRGVKTLALRVRQQNANALALARFLRGHAAVSAVWYPGLEDDPHHARAREWFAGFGSVVAFELRGGVDAAERFLDRVRLPVIGPSLGGIETLLTRPVTTSHRGLSAAERARAGITDGLIRLSLGIEDAEDLIGDFDQALAGGHS
jgi:cystathionine beta-lyase/cystathionine gamma-synthase